MIATYIETLEFIEAAQEYDRPEPLFRDWRAVPDTSPLTAPPPGAGGWGEVLSRLRLGGEPVEWIARKAAATGTTMAAELVASGLVGDEELYRAMAATFDIAFLDHIAPERLIFREDPPEVLLRRPAGPQIARYDDDAAVSLIVLAPDRANLELLGRYLARDPALRARLRFTTPAILRKAVLARARSHMCDHATNTLFDRHEAYSARTVVNGWQGATAGAFAVALPVALLVAPHTTFLGIHIVSTVFFLGCVGLRLAAALSWRREPQRRPREFATADMPRYCVLVALYREAPIVPDLLVALSKIVWPRSKLEIKLVCEADDDATLAALNAQQLKPWIEVVEVPPGLPRTKPKALSYALPLTSADFVALYDAEDRPHPLQLIEAWQKFTAADDDVACLQAPLSVTLTERSPIQRGFRFEYAALFRGLLPFLSRRALILPLGGTSNHFRRDALEAVGGWDPFNVTEDADLGARLGRFGYRAETLSHPTYEDAPADLSEWLPQRTRWLKGWMQTWLVHMRNPAALYRELGPGSFLTFQILFAGMIVSALVHPLLIVTLAFLLCSLSSGTPLSTSQEVLLVIDSVNIVLGYGAFLLLGTRVMQGEEKRGLWKVVAFTPIYWTLISVAGWRALWQLYRAPHHWEKTPHLPPRLRRRAARG